MRVLFVGLPQAGNNGGFMRPQLAEQIRRIALGLSRDDEPSILNAQREPVLPDIADEGSGIIGLRFIEVGEAGRGFWRF